MLLISFLAVFFPLLLSFFLSITWHWLSYMPMISKESTQADLFRFVLHSAVIKIYIDCFCIEVKDKAFNMCTLYNIIRNPCSMLTHQYLNSCQMARVQFVFQRSHTIYTHIHLYAKCLIELFKWISWLFEYTSMHTRKRGLLSNYGKVQWFFSFSSQILCGCFGGKKMQIHTSVLFMNRSQFIFCTQQ